MGESATLEAIRKAVNALPFAMCWRNTVGKCRHGDRWISYGLGVGSPDLIGLISPGGRFLGLEVKSSSGELSDAQRLWLKKINGSGGLAAVVRNVPDAVALVTAEYEICKARLQ